MFPANLPQDQQTTDEMDTCISLPLVFVVQPDIQLYKLLSDLSDETNWEVRKVAAQKLGRMRKPEALQGLLDALPEDPFWMVRCAIIQALERIGDRLAIPILREVARSDGFQVVRAYARKAIEMLSSVG